MTPSLYRAAEDRGQILSLEEQTPDAVQISAEWDLDCVKAGDLWRFYAGELCPWNVGLFAAVWHIILQTRHGRVTNSISIFAGQCGGLVIWAFNGRLCLPVPLTFRLTSLVSSGKGQTCGPITWEIRIGNVTAQSLN